jgi:ubiquinone/menaquinone biosynthesis C-methylase UbiE/uncharacterized membrane protein YbhN (UPF0104 family)
MSSGLSRLARRPLLYVVFSVSAFWAAAFYFAPRGTLAALERVPAASVLGALLLTCANLLLRFMRWHFLLRRCRLYPPTRESLALFTAALPMALTPLYLGELVKPWVLKRRHGFPLSASLTVVLFERFLDVLALAVLAAALAPGGATRTIAGVAALALGALVLMRGALLRLFHLAARVRFLHAVSGALRPSAAALHALAEPRALAQALVPTFLAWALAGATLPLLGRGLPGAPGPSSGIGLYAAATLAGAATGLPGGIGALELTLGAALRRGGLAAGDAAALVLLVRLATLWFAFALGAVVLFTRFRRYLTFEVEPERAHFEELSSVYDAQIPPHMAERLLGRKVDLIERALRRAGREGAHGLDLGCGTGWYSRDLERRGFRITSLDRSEGQAGRARERRDARGAVAVGDAVRLPFRDGVFDFAYAINVIHHLPDRRAQTVALAELRRVLRPGGSFFVHEINVVNPVFRLYMVYVFPVIRDIDQGNELWLGPRDRFEGFQGGDAVFFTFLPDFLPAGLVRLLAPLERALERSRLRSWSAHFMLELRKSEKRPDRSAAASDP